MALSKKPSPVVRGSLATVNPSRRRRSVSASTASLLPVEKEKCANPIWGMLSAGEVTSV